MSQEKIDLYRKSIDFMKNQLKVIYPLIKDINFIKINLDNDDIDIEHIKKFYKFETYDQVDLINKANKLSQNIKKYEELILKNSQP